ncbi:hypothetical protein GB928_021330 [Shinella curvata]|uniref:Lipoprotein n=1 Tax=Shinella curvata TaxID=1817964 RepID=A0ABT8XJ66_9HYPH|nr:hypothetical protein [Shinella curvata]MCJ8052663.1 hypothetical protein [Shinella curvata]MDO6123743.1 hypothetical protein [Shinella curvata]
MRRNRAFLTGVVMVMAGAFVLAGCTTAPPRETGVHSSSSEAQLRAHQRKQRLRAEQGGYKRLYRPRDCRSAVAGKCSGFPTYDPS